MTKLVITADIHGMYTPWRKIKALLGPRDTLAVAGDLFDTRYGSSSRPDFQPERIREEFTGLNLEKHYVYGNCDEESFYEGHSTLTDFSFNGLRFILNHGHRYLPDLTDFDIIIQGHTHVAKLDSVMGKVFLNPGSPTMPRNGYPSCAILEGKDLKIINLANEKTVHHLTW